jgi:hypothetical protein
MVLLLVRYCIVVAPVALEGEGRVTSDLIIEQRFVALLLAVTYGIFDE